MPVSGNCFCYEKGRIWGWACNAAFGNGTGTWKKHGAFWNQFISYFYLLIGAAGIPEGPAGYKDSVSSLFDGGVADDVKFIAGFIVKTIFEGAF